MTEDQPALPHHRVLLSIIPRITGSLSIVGSSSIIYHIIRRGEWRSKVYHQLLLGMSCFDVVMSFAFALSTWPVPQWYRGAHGARGNSGTCTAQGFALQISGVAVPMYNTSLSIYYLLLIRYRWQESRLRRDVAPWMHAVPVTMGLATAIAFLLLKLFNPMEFFCWIAPLPIDCNQSYNSAVEDADCVRGDNADVYALLVFLIVWVCICLATAAMLSVFQSVLNQERAVARYRYNDNDPHRDDLKRSKQVARQALFYILAFFVTWLPATVHAILIATANYHVNSHIVPLASLELIFFPLQGFFNAIVYFRPLRECRRNKSFRCLLWPAKKEVKAQNNESNNTDENDENDEN